MARITVAASAAFDLTAAAAGLGRAGPGAAAGDAFAWTSPAGFAWRAESAPGGLTLGPDGAPSGEPVRLALGPAAAPILTLRAEDGATLGLALAALAGPTPADPGGLDPAFAEADALRISGPAEVLIGADGVLARDRAVFAGDVIRAKGAGARHLSGDALVALASADTVTAGDDRISATGTGEALLWGDAIRLSPGGPGALFTGGDDTLSAEGTGAHRLMIGDVGTVEAGWILAAGDDRLKGGRSVDGLVGDAFTVEPLGRVEAGDDRLSGGGGDDVLHGDVEALRGGVLLPGDDTLLGGRGRDLLVGDVRRVEDGSRVEGGGRDRLSGGGGDDRLLGGPGRDRLDGDAGADRLDGGAGRDRLSGGAGGDRMEGGGGRDHLKGGRGRDRMDGEGGADRLEGGGGDDRLSGAGGRDRLEGGPGADRLAGGAGADLFRFRPGDGRDEITDFRLGTDDIALAGGLPPFVATPRKGGTRLISDGVTVDLPDLRPERIEDADPDWLA